MSYLVHARADESIIAEITADVGRDDFTVDAIARHEILVLSVA